MSAETHEVSREKLVADLKQVVGDAEDLVKATMHQTGDKIAAARAKAEETLKQAKARLDELEKAAVEQAKAAAKATDVYVREHPWQAVGIAAGVGFLVGWILGRK